MSEKVELNTEVKETVVRQIKPSPTTEYARTRFEELTKLKEELLLEIKPYRDDYEALANHPRLIECRNMIKQFNPLIGSVDNELAQLSKLLGGKQLSQSEGK